MYGMPPEMGPVGFDTSMLTLSIYMLAGLGTLNAIAIALGVVSLPVFFIILWLADRFFGMVSSITGWFPAKLVLIMFRGLRRSPLRTSLTYLALFVLTLVLVLHLRGPHMIGNATTEKEANFKAIVTHKTTIPSQMPPGYYTEFKRLVPGGTAAGNAAGQWRQGHHELVASSSARPTK